MLAQYYNDEKTYIRLFEDGNSTKILDIPVDKSIRETLMEWGFPSLKYWKRTSWGRELEFKFVTEV